VVLNKNIIENETLQSNEKLTIGHSMKNLWTDFTRILGNSFLLGITIIGSLVVLVVIFGGIISVIGEGGGGGAIGLAVILVIILLFAMLIFGPILSFVPIAAMFVCQRDHIGIFPAIGKVFRFMKDNFWITWAVSFVGILTYSFLSWFAQVPVFIMTLISTFSRIKDIESSGVEGFDTSTSMTFIIVSTICTLLTYGITVIYHLIVIYQYTNLEEKKEGQSILEKINQIQ
jgi:hypothetical protein